MAIQNIAMKAYTNALEVGNRIEGRQTGLSRQAFQKNSNEKTSFAETISDSLQQVNKMQEEKTSMIEAFASGENQNVHELMITLQKASIAMNMTSTVRNKVMEAYKELSRMQF